MKIRAALNAVLDPANSVCVTGDEESRKRARDQWHRARSAAQVTS